MKISKITIAILAVSVLTGCGAGSSTVKVSPYASYDCDRLFKAMEYKVSEAKILYTNYEDEDSAGKIGSGVLKAGTGAALASALILTPAGWILAGGMMLAGASDMMDGVAHSELSDAEERQLFRYGQEYGEMRKEALKKKCDYYSIPLWDVSPK